MKILLIPNLALAPMLEHGQKQSPGLRRDGFTLVEMLVVIAVLSILASFLLPALSRSKQKVQGIYCMNNGKQLITAFHMYAADHNDWLPPNPDVGSSPINWVRGDMRIPSDATNTAYLTEPRYAKLAPYTGAAPGLYKCPADKSTTTINGQQYPRVRTFSMSQAVGTKPLPPLAPVDGPWLDGTHHHKANQPWRTYGKLADMVAPTPAMLWVLLDEEEHSINDAAFAVSMVQPTRWIDVPGSYHNLACGIAFADAHSEIHRWLEAGTKAAGEAGGPKLQPNSRDIAWLQQRTSAKADAGSP